MSANTPQPKYSRAYVTWRFGEMFVGPDFGGEVIVRIGLQPAAHGQPFRGLIGPSLPGPPVPFPPRRVAEVVKRAASPGSVRKSVVELTPQAWAISSVAGS